jgi:hypothetical protein
MRQFREAWERLSSDPARLTEFLERAVPTIRRWEFDVTIAIAAITKPENVIVCVADRMISFGDELPAQDNATLKAIRLNTQWELAWAANDVNLIEPIVAIARKHINDTHRWDGPDAARIVAEAYSDILHKDFVAKYLARFGYRDMEQFRTEGRDDLGNRFDNLCVELGRFSLGAAFILFGHDKQNEPKLYEIEDPGRVIDKNLLRYAVIGSGYQMARATLQWPPPLTYMLEDTIYRLLEAKFFAETATGVGKTTTVILRNREGRVTLLSREDIGKIRKIWETEVANVPTPHTAIELLAKSRAVTDLVVAG